MASSQNRMKVNNSSNIVLGESYKVTKEFVDRMCGEASKVDHTKLVAHVVKVRTNGVNITLNRVVETFLGFRDDFNIMKSQFDDYLIPYPKNDSKKITTRKTTA
jgi:hypothetical protein